MHRGRSCAPLPAMGRRHPQDDGGGLPDAMAPRPGAFVLRSPSPLKIRKQGARWQHRTVRALGSSSCLLTMPFDILYLMFLGYPLGIFRIALNAITWNSGGCRH